MIKKKLSNAVILGSSSLSKGNVSITNEKLNQTQDRIELDHRLNYNQITNCILSAPNGVATYSGKTITAKQGLKVLIPNGRNTDRTLNNIEYVVPSDATYTYTFSLLIPDDKVFIQDNNTITRLQSEYVYRVKSYSQLSTDTGINEYRFAFVDDDNLWYVTSNTGADWNVVKMAQILSCSVGADNITSLTTDNPVELVKRTDKEEITSWGMPDYSATIDITSSLTNTNSSWTSPNNGVVLANCNNQEVVYLFSESNFPITTNRGKLLIGIDGEIGIGITDNIYISKGQKIYTASNYPNNGKIFFCPLKGVN